MKCPFFQTSCPNPSYKNWCPTYPTSNASQHWITNPIPRFLVPPSPRCIGLKLHLDIFSMTSLMLWCFCQMNKYWFKVVSKNVAWNALEIVWINGKCYLNAIKKNFFERSSFQAQFDFELHCLNKCLGMNNYFLIVIWIWIHVMTQLQGYMHLCKFQMYPILFWVLNIKLKMYNFFSFLVMKMELSTQGLGAFFSLCLWLFSLLPYYYSFISHCFFWLPSYYFLMTFDKVLLGFY